MKAQEWVRGRVHKAVATLAADAQMITLGSWQSNAPARQHMQAFSKQQLFHNLLPGSPFLTT
jgi:hypothetical protein